LPGIVGVGNFLLVDLGDYLNGYEIFYKKNVISSVIDLSFMSGYSVYVYK